MLRLDTFRQKWEAFSMLLALLLVACASGLDAMHREPAPVMIITGNAFYDLPSEQPRPCNWAWLPNHDEWCRLKHI